MFFYAASIFVLFVSFAAGQAPYACAHKSSTTCGYYLSHNTSDFNRANQICNFYDDSILASLQVITDLNIDDRLKWVGFKLPAHRSRWIWIGDGKPLTSEVEDLWSDEMVRIKSKEISYCVAIARSVKSTKWFVLPCNDSLNESICQRPLRDRCHQWNFTYGCLWEDERCEHRYESKTHDADDGADKCPVRTGNRVFRMPCESKMCTNCKLSVWSLWSKCTANCQISGFRRRNRSVLMDATNRTSCHSLKLVETLPCKANCSSTSSKIIKHTSPNLDAAGEETADNPSRTNGTQEAEKSHSATNISTITESTMQVSNESAGFEKSSQTITDVAMNPDKETKERPRINGTEESDKKTTTSTANDATEPTQMNFFIIVGSNIYLLILCLLILLIFWCKHPRNKRKSRKEAKVFNAKKVEEKEERDCDKGFSIKHQELTKGIDVDLAAEEENL